MSSPLTHGGRDAEKAFTLIELLTVIAIIGILSAITLGIVRGVQEKGAISRARSDLAALSQALEAYKRQYGDYPQLGASAGNPDETASATTVEGLLFNALMGKVGPTKVAIQGKQFLEASKFSLQSTNVPTSGNTTAVANAFTDPWGRIYLYYYKEAGANVGNWKQPSFLLFSAGADGKIGISVNAAGAITETDAAQAADNLYANR